MHKLFINNSMQKKINILEDRELLLKLMSKLLNNLLTETQNLPRKKSAFDCRNVPTISIHDYLLRTYFCTQECSSMRIAPTLSSWPP